MKITDIKKETKKEVNEHEYAPPPHTKQMAVDPRLAMEMRKVIQFVDHENLPTVKKWLLDMWAEHLGGK